ncbi:MAG: hypothetical protein ACE5K1_12980 [Acidiferrobacterales bacterium]
MGYLITQVLLCLLIAALIGFVIGWLLRHVICKKQSQALEAGWTAHLRRVQAERDELSARAASLQRDTAARAAPTTSRSIEQESGEHVAHSPSAGTATDTTTADPTVVTEGLEYAIKELKPGLTTPIRPRALSAPQGEPDDLKQIGGVGRKIEKKLHNLGIYHFHQIADFTQQHIAWIDEYLVFKGRIQREHWIEQARELAAGRQTEFSRRYLTKRGK